MDKLVLEIHKSTPITSELVRISEEARNKVREIQIETGLSASVIVSKMILFAAENYVIKEVK